MTTRIQVEVGAKQRFKADVEGIKKATKDIESSLSGVATKAGAAFAAFTGGITLSIREASKIESVTTRFEVLTGSVAQATKTVKELQDFSARTPFSFEGISNAGAQLLSFGVQAENLVPTLQRIGDVAAASGSDINEIALIFGQVSAAGKLTGERLLQLQERAIPIGPALAKTLGVTESAVRDLVSSGQVGFKDFEKAFNSLSDQGGAAFGGIEKQSQTLAGQLSTLKDNFSLVAAEIGKFLLPVAKQATQALTGILQAIRENPETAKFIAQVLAVGAALTGIITAVATGALVFIKLGSALAIAATAVKTFGFAVATALGPIGLLVLAITGLAVLVAANFDKIKAVFSSFAENVSEIFGGIGKLIIGVFTFDKDKIKDGFNETKEAVKEAVANSLEEIAALDEEARAEDESGRELSPIERLFSPNPEKVGEQFDATNELVRGKTEELTELQQMQLDAQRAIDKQRIDLQKKTNETFLKEQIKFGTSFAAINKVINSDQIQGAKSATGELVALQQSENSTLKKIGKAAAVAQITIKTAESAMNIYRGFSIIPFIGPALGIAGAAAAVAFGAEQIGKVVSAQRGGLIEGGIRGRDSVPALLEPGELVVPRQNFDEVISAVQGARNQAGGSTDVDSDEEMAAAVVRVDFESEAAAQIITAQETEDTALGVSRRRFA